MTSGEYFEREESSELKLKARTTPSSKEKSASQQIDAIIEESFDSHEIVKERNHEISAHFWRHHQQQHP